MILGHEGHEVDGREGSAGWNLVVPSHCPDASFVSKSAAQLPPLPSGLLLCQFVKLRMYLENRCVFLLKVPSFSFGLLSGPPIQTPMCSPDGTCSVGFHEVEQR